jgi:hypothetical protein
MSIFRWGQSMFVIRLLQWPLMILIIGITSLAISVAAGAWFNSSEYLFHVIR